MKQLFLLEDDMSLISGLSFAVKKQGYEIDVARTTLEADTLWETSKYDLAILDVSLPDGSGFDFCKKIFFRIRGIAAIDFTCTHIPIGLMPHPKHYCFRIAPAFFCSRNESVSEFVRMTIRKYAL